MTPIFKITRADGMFSKGGCCPSWSKDGKSWNNIGHVKSSVGTRDTGSGSGYPSDSEVVVYELVEVDRYPLQDLIDENRERRADVQAKREAVWKHREYERKLKELESLKNELGM